jgi:hypothetical protein
VNAEYEKKYLHNINASVINEFIIPLQICVQEIFHSIYEALCTFFFLLVFMCFSFVGILRIDGKVIFELVGGWRVRVED